MAFYPFETAEVALENIKSIRESKVSENYADFIATNLPSVEKKKYQLAVEDPYIS